MILPSWNICRTLSCWIHCIYGISMVSLALSFCTAAFSCRQFPSLEALPCPTSSHGEQVEWIICCLLTTRNIQSLVENPIDYSSGGNGRGSPGTQSSPRWNMLPDYSLIWLKIICHGTGCLWLLPVPRIGQRTAQYITADAYPWHYIRPLSDVERIGFLLSFSNFLIFLLDFFRY